MAPANPIADQGLSVVYDPPGLAIVDIVFVHGLQGHPFRTWASTKSANLRSASGQAPAGQEKQDRLKTFLANLTRPENRRLGAKTPGGGSGHPTMDAKPSRNADPGRWFWPKDSVPTACPEARVLTWGYDTVVSRLGKGPACKGSISSHSRDLLWGLERTRDDAISKERPLIFVAHSLGGIVVKEVWAVWIRLANKGRSIISALGFDTASATLDALGLRSTDLERCQESFSSLWRRYDFRVKTFQESLGMSGINIGPLNDQWERFKGSTRLYTKHGKDHLESRGRISPHQAGHKALEVGRRVSARVERHKGIEERRNRNLKGFERRRVRGSCQWIFTDPNFDLWRRDCSNSNDDANSGLLWILGHPGSGKSTVMEEAYRNFPRDDTRPQVFAFFFDSNARQKLLRHPCGLYRSLLYQIFSLRPNTCRTLDMERPLLRTDLQRWKYNSWATRRYQDTLEAVLVKPSSPPTVLFIDGLDECGESVMRRIAMFFSSVAKLARASGVQLSVCLASRTHGAPITAVGCPTIWMERNNAGDIKTYVHQRLSAFHETVLDIDSLIRTVLEMSQGIFVWVVLAIDSLARDLERGLNVRFLQGQLLKLPGGLHGLYREILDRNTDDRKMRLRFFQWVIFGGDIQLREWRDILPFLGDPMPQSLRTSQWSQYYADTDEQLIKLVRDLSLGLVHVTGHILSESRDVGGSVVESIGPAAGSLNSQEGNTRIVGVIHETVRDFFLNSDGFLILSDNGSRPTAGDGYETILNTCLDLIQVPELDPIVERRLHMAGPRQDTAPSSSSGSEDGRSHRSGESSVGSYHSAGSLRQKRVPADRHGPSPPEPTGIHAQLDPRPADPELLNARMGDFLASLPLPVGWDGDPEGAPPDALNTPLPAKTADDVPATHSERSAVTKPWDYPDCMPYIVGTFADHALRGQSANMDPTAIISRLFGPTNVPNTTPFKRLLVLSEAPDPEVYPPDWASSKSLHSWELPLSPRGGPYYLL
ncbi:hypothetical protein MAPG_06342 [Magnaporthiopsis poae ATCC 64411]|uniref:Nephrocystin 3-like N-terminal domain-containing protein n=1 Tax=Magnaporthiopsis poae (strain ATCC 64411 / 73-15) TaxID=644358 RepID=A0A0C4E1S3_MAGP6|nr:hypothetical protein MAPG_06342 [Magnaporthiopsis poae ATCC 64411]